MFKRIIIWFLMIATFTFLHAAQSDLQVKLAKLQTLPKSERFILMNEIKKELAQMNAEQRQTALKKLRASMQKGNGDHAGQGAHAKHEGLHLQNGIGTQSHQSIQHQTIQNDQQHDVGQASQQTRPSPQPQMGNSHARK